MRRGREGEREKGEGGRAGEREREREREVCSDSYLYTFFLEHIKSPDVPVQPDVPGRNRSPYGQENLSEENLYGAKP